MAIAPVVTWNETPNVYAWKYPEENLATWTQLIVRESQEAVLFKDGQHVGPFAAGRHVLSTANYPVLSSLLKIPSGRSPFFAEVWFVRKNFNLDVKWGTTTPIQLEDPKYHVMLPVSAFGQFGITVKDSVKFLVKLVGTMPAFTQKTLTDYFRGQVVMRAKEEIARYLVEDGVSILQLGAKLGEVSAKLETTLSEAFEDYGLELVRFSTASISTDEKDPAVARLRRALAERAEMDILGDRYQMKRSFDTMDTAAAGAAGGNNAFAGAGMGLGIGMGMGGAMFGMTQQMAGNLSTGLPHAAAPVAAAVGAKFCPNCGTPVTPGAKFCAGCGNKLA